jgi:pimeloyl-ACP methyl ester carboxylesterase
MRNALLAFLLMASSGCTIALKVPVPYEHIIMLNSNGIAIDPTGNTDCRYATAGGVPARYLCNGAHDKVRGYRELTGIEYGDYIDRVLEALDRSGKSKILIFIHGGLNTQLGTIERATYLEPVIEASESFPIFVNWRSSFTSNYLEHLLFVRQGEYWKATGWLQAPVYLAGDITRSIVRSPLVYLQMSRSDLDSRRSSAAQENASAAAQRLELSEKKHPGESIQFIPGDDRRTYCEMKQSTEVYAVTVPTKLATAPLIDLFGTSAWGSMIRRTRTAYHTDREFDDEASVSYDDLAAAREPAPAAGGLSVFLRHLASFIDAHPERKWQITLVGHSMGAIVLNEAVRDFGTHPEREQLPIRNIVYMAAACSVRDYEDTMFPYLREHSEVNLYHLVLHPAAEVRDRVVTGGWDLPPRGSLLVWIDNFLESPVGPLDRTAGRFVNLMAAVHDTDPPIRKQIHIREFSVGNSVSYDEPQKHGDFGNLDFWRPECWMMLADYADHCYHPRRDESTIESGTPSKDENCTKRSATVVAGDD